MTLLLIQSIKNKYIYIYHLFLKVVGCLKSEEKKRRYTILRRLANDLLIINKNTIMRKRNVRKKGACCSTR
jgi:predicted DNA-binding transcriptional regulator